MKVISIQRGLGWKYKQWKGKLHHCDPPHTLSSGSLSFESTVKMPDTVCLVCVWFISFTLVTAVSIIIFQAKMPNMIQFQFLSCEYLLCEVKYIWVFDCVYTMCEFWKAFLKVYGTFELLSPLCLCPYHSCRHRLTCSKCFRLDGYSFIYEAAEILFTVCLLTACHRFLHNFILITLLIHTSPY